MIEDIRETLADGQSAEFDVVIVGSGPAGITVALGLKESGLRVAVLEAGGRETQSSEDIDLYKGRIGGLPYSLTGSRQRFFGGTSNHWGGWCRRLDPLDFEARDHVPLSGWPIGHAELEPWYERAEEICEIAVPNYAADRFVDNNALLEFPEPSGFVNAAFRFSPPTRFGNRYADKLSEADNVNVLLHANVIAMDHRDGRIRAVRVGTHEGQHYSIEAGCIVLAMGGLETPRLLLHTRTGTRPALGDHSDFLGRCFMDHFGFRPGVMLTRGELRYFRHESGSDDLMPVLTMAEKVQKQERYQNFCIGLRATEPDPAFPPVSLSNPGMAAREGEYWNYIVQFINEQSPNRDSRVLLTDETDALGMRRLKLNWQVRERDFENVRRVVARLARWLGVSGAGRLRYSRKVDEENTQRLSSGLHHIGTCRMSSDPDHGVVDADCLVHGTENLYIAGSSVFPTCGYANPTLTLVALAARLADHIRRGNWR